MGMINVPSGSPYSFADMAVLFLMGVLLIGTVFAQDRPPAPAKSGRILGLAFERVQVSDLKRSIEYYQSLGCTLKSDANPPWTQDEDGNRLFHTPGAMSRSVMLTIPSFASGQPFPLYLQQFKGIDRTGRVDFPARDPSSPHFGLVEPEADALWTKLKASGTLRPLSWDGKLIRMPGQTSGGIAYVRDPDVGAFVELFEK
jgi:hypothetical protein